MATGEIDARVREFVMRHIDSLEQLEVLLLLRTRPERTWTPKEVSAELRTTERSSGTRLAALAAGGLLREDPAGAYRYAPRAPELDAAAGDLAEAYAVRRIAVTNLIFARPLSQVRTFADAFKLRED
ncbi:MAG TPA: hypothetical protein VMT87_12480 [Vicinamibacteria bacterium]|nr:hypothetical protein [Vicinamibacteria bacterium]